MGRIKTKAKRFHFQFKPEQVAMVLTGSEATGQTWTEFTEDAVTAYYRELVRKGKITSYLKIGSIQNPKS